jgi:hypothetical protein
MTPANQVHRDVARVLDDRTTTVSASATASLTCRTSPATSFRTHWNGRACRGRASGGRTIQKDLSGRTAATDVFARKTKTANKGCRTDQGAVRQCALTVGSGGRSTTTASNAWRLTAQRACNGARAPKRATSTTASAGPIAKYPSRRLAGSTQGLVGSGGCRSGPTDRLDHLSGAVTRSTFASVDLTGAVAVRTEVLAFAFV